MQRAITLFAHADELQFLTAPNPSLLFKKIATENYYTSVQL